jgi:hypothetical protein
LDPAWWRRRQDNIRAGRLEDVFAYSLERRFPRTRPAPEAAAGSPDKSALAASV